ncbi:MAG: hypothetical protein KDK36_06960, partial [Leptospiraceae bacterium]|nr:hypothetical protein [Leptospiraceae bacterium]
MENLKQLEIIPEKSRAIVEEGLSAILKRRRLGGYNLDYIQIENFLSGGKTGAIVFAASFGLKEKSLEGKYYRVLKIALGNICRNEKAGADLNEKLQLDTFSNLTYSSEDDFLFENPKTGEKENYGVLLYQDIGIASENKLQNFYSALSEAMNNPNMGKAKRLCLNLSSQLQKEIFSGLKRSLYKLLKEEKVNLSEYYGDKFSRKVLEGITELQKIDSTIPDPKYLKSIFDETSIYHSVSYIHGDLHPENLLIWKLDDLSYRSKLIDFGEVIPKRMERFTPLFWDFSRLLGEVILNFIEDELNLSKPHDKNIDFLKSIDGSLNRLWFIFDSIFSGDFNKLENVDFKFQLLGNIYFNTLFSFLYES